MASSETLEYSVWLIWNLLSLTPVKIKNPNFDLVLPTEDAVKKLMSDSLVVLAPGLLDVVQAAIPPSITYFKRLPTDCKRRWGVYLLVLEKPGCRPKIYVGSGTNAYVGVTSWFGCYNTDTNLPQLVKLALDDGFRIEHKGLLCWVQMPAAKDMFVVRVLFLAIEAAFSTVLWAMQSRTKDYGLPPLCPWFLDGVEYDGCCSHSALTEGISGEEDGLTVEQIAVKHVEMVARRAAANSARYYDRKANDPETHHALQLHYAKNRTNEQNAESLRNSRKKAKLEKRFACDVCHEAFSNSYELNRHYDSKRHKDMVSGNARTSHFCKLCNHGFRDSTKLNQHRKSQKHKDNVARVALSKSGS